MASGEAAETPAEEPAEEQPAEEPAAENPVKTEENSDAAGLVYGSYLSEKETPFSTIVVTVNTKNDVITDCTVRCDAKEGQTDLVKDEDEEVWAKAVVETQGAELDTVAGATISSDAVREAVAEIRQQIAGTPVEAEEPAEEPAADQPEEEMKAEEAAPEADAEQPAEETESEQPAEESTAAEEAPAPAAFGGYLAVKETDFSVIRIIVSTRSGVITDCKVICDAKEGQMDLVTDENEEAWAKAVVETQGAELDTVTGATVSSDAVREAVAEILEKIR